MPMSNKNTAHKLPRKPTDAARAIREDARYGVSFLRSHWKRLLLLFAGVLLPLWGFGELAEEVRQADPFPSSRGHIATDTNESQHHDR